MARKRFGTAWAIALVTCVHASVDAGEEPILRPTTALRPFVGLTIQSKDSAGPTPVPGWEFSPVDLNAGVGGKYIYAGWKRGSQQAITRIGFGAYNSAQQDNPWPDWQWNRNDLNRGAGGQYIYMFWQRNPRYVPVYNMTFIVTSQSSPPPIPGYRPIQLDLNRGAGGPYIWPYVSFASSIATQAKHKVLRKRSHDGSVLGDEEEVTISVGEQSQTPSGMLPQQLTREGPREEAAPPIPTRPQKRMEKIAPREPLTQFDRPQIRAKLIEVSELIQAAKARETFDVAGNGLTVAVLDTGLRTTHVDFSGRVIAQKNFTSDNEANPKDASDGEGHGTNVGGIIVANGDHVGIAPEAKIIPIKVLDNRGRGSFQSMEDGLQWVIDNRQRYNITVVNMSLGDPGNYTSDDFGEDSFHERVRELREAKVAVVISAGNGFFNHNSKQGMSYPGILREAISVGAVYDANEGEFTYMDGATAYSTAAGRITPFSQRLHPSVSQDTRTDIFAPGAPVRSAGIKNDHGESVQHGTSQAAPVTAGVVLLMQQYYLTETGALPSVDDLETWLRRGGVEIKDGDDEEDNVDNTQLNYIHLSAISAMSSIATHLEKQLLTTKRAIK